MPKKVSHVSSSKLFYLVILVGFIFQLITFTLKLYGDSAAMAQFAYLVKHSSVAWLLYAHLPIGFLFYFISFSVFGVSDFSIHLVPFIFNLGSFYLIYKLTEQIYDVKIAKIAVVLCLFTFFPFSGNIFVDLGGSIAVFFNVLLLLSFFYFTKNNSCYWVLVGCVSAGIFFSLKLQHILVFPSLVLFIYMLKKNIKQTCKYSAYLFLSTFLFFLINILFVKLISGEFFIYFITRVFSHSAQFTTPLWVKLTSPLKFINLFVAMTPLYMVLPILRMSARLKKDYLLFVWLVPSIVLFILLAPIELAGTYPRYFVIFYPPLVMLSAAYLYEKFYALRQFKSLDFILLGVFSVLFVFASVIFNSVARNHWFFMTADGPIIKINQLLLAFYGISPFVMLVLHSFFVKLQRIKFANFCFYSVCVILISFNLFLFAELFFDSTHQTLIDELKDFSITNRIKEPIYSWNSDVPYYVNTDKKIILNILNELPLTELMKRSNITGLNYVDLDSDFDAVKKVLDLQGGTVILLNYPAKYVLSEENKEKIKFFEQRCTRLKNSQCKYGDLMIFGCSNSSN